MKVHDARGDVCLSLLRYISEDRNMLFPERNAIEVVNPVCR